jgi:hypothetical protein
MTRKEIIDQVRARKMKHQDAAKHLGVSKARVTQLVQAADKREAKAAALFAPKPAAPPPGDPGFEIVKDPAPAPTPEAMGGAPTVPTPDPVNLKSVLGPTGQSPDPSTVAAEAAQRPVAPVSAVDPDDVKAGRALLKLLNINVGKATAQLVYDVPEGDPRLAEFNEHNGFMKVAMERNSDKAAPVGKLSSGWKGILIGLIAEGVRVVAKFGWAEFKEKMAEEKAKVEANPPAPAAVAETPKPPENPVSPAATVPGPKLTTQQKIDAFKKRHGYK